MALPVPQVGAFAFVAVVPASAVADVSGSLLPVCPSLPPGNALSDLVGHYHLTTLLDYHWILSGFHPLAFVAPGCGGAGRYRCFRRFQYLSLQRSADVGLPRRPPCRQ